MADKYIKRVDSSGNVIQRFKDEVDNRRNVSLSAGSGKDVKITNPSSISAGVGRDINTDIYFDEWNKSDSIINIPESEKQSGITKNNTPYDKVSWILEQKDLYDLWSSNGKTSNKGIATLDNRYLVAVSTKFGKVGDKIDVLLDNGDIIKCIIADAKGDDAESEWGHYLELPSGDMGIDVIEWQSVGDINIDDWKNEKVISIISKDSNVLE